MVRRAVGLLRSPPISVPPIQNRNELPYEMEAKANDQYHNRCNCYDKGKGSIHLTCLRYRACLPYNLSGFEAGEIDPAQSLSKDPSYP